MYIIIIYIRLARIITRNSVAYARDFIFPRAPSFPYIFFFFIFLTLHLQEVNVRVYLRTHKLFFCYKTYKPPLPSFIIRENSQHSICTHDPFFFYSLDFAIFFNNFFIRYVDRYNEKCVRMHVYLKFIVIFMYEKLKFMKCERGSVRVWVQ